jgi:hypothetical protein
MKRVADEARDRALAPDSVTLSSAALPLNYSAAIAYPVAAEEGMKMSSEPCVCKPTREELN